MENWQRKHINDKLPELIQMTRFNTVVQARLQSEGILSEDDISSLEATQQTGGRIKQSTHLYDLLTDRPFAYEILTKALFETNQSGVSKILLDGFTKAGIRTSLTHCGIRIEHDDFENTIILAYGKRFKLNEFFPNVDTTTLHKVFFETLSEHVYFDSLIKKKEIELFKNTIPPVPDFYVPRYISNRIKINEDVFKCSCPDIFVFKGMERYKISGLAKPSQTASSRHQLECITCRFIYLDRDEDWEPLRDAATVPIHLITFESCMKSNTFQIKSNTTYYDSEWSSISSSDEDNADLSPLDDEEADLSSLYEEDEAAVVESITFSDTMGADDVFRCNRLDNSFILENTSGISEVLSMFCSEQNRAYVKEEEFVEQHLAKKKISSGVCICDAPGMGKTMLLGNIARNFVKQRPTSCVAFIQLSDFVQNMPRPLPNLDKDPLFALLCTLQYITPTSDSASVLKKLGEKGFVSIYLFFDGFDEINSRDVEWIKKMFKLLKTYFPVIDIFVTSRPHMRRDLESSLKVVAYDILQFNLDNQVDFLVKFWLQEFPTCRQSSLRTYALRVLEVIKNTLSENERGIAGIPLLCGLIASVYAKEAEISSSSDQTGEIRCPTRSICQMYKEFIDTKINSTVKLLSMSKDKFNQDTNIDEKSLKYFHVRQEWKLLFPDNRIFEDLEDFHNINVRNSVIYKVGIMQQGSSGNNRKLEFVHRTFAEYLMADCLAEYLLSSKFDDSKYDVLFEFFITVVLSVEKIIHFDFGDSFVFRHSVIGYFLNSLLNPEIGFRVSEKQIKLKEELLSAEFLYSVIIICGINSYTNIFSIPKRVLLSGHSNVVQRYDQYFTKEKCFKILCFALRYSNFDIANVCFQITCQVFNHDMMEICHMRGESYFYDVTLLQLAVRFGQYEAVEFLIDKTDHKSQNLLHECIEHPIIQDFTQIKLSIFQLLFKNDNQLFDECPDLLMTTQMHLKLLIAFVKSGARIKSTNPNELEDKNANCVTFAATYMSPSDFHKLLVFLLDDCQAHYLFCENPKTNMTLPIVIKYVALLPKTLDMLLNIPGIDINLVNKYGNNLAISAVLGNHLTSLKMLVEQGTNYKCTGEFQRSLMHFAAHVGSRHIIAFLISLGLGINQCDENGLTPILLASVHSLETVKTFVEHGADCFVSEKDGRSMLHYAAQHGKLDIIEYCVNRGINIDVKDNQQCSPIMIAAFFGKVDTVKFLVKLGADYNTTNKFGVNLLHVAAERGNIKVVKYCIELGMDINKGTKFGITPVMGAVVWATEKVTMVCLLYNLGADCTLTNNNGENILHLTAKYGDEELISLCIELGLDPNQQTNDGYSPIMIAVMNKNLAFIPALIESGADCNLVTKIGQNILHLTTQINDVDIVEYCLNLGLNINQLDFEQRTPVLWAAFLNKFPTIRCLIENGADYNQSNSTGWDASCFAAKNENIELLQYLQEKRWNPNSLNANGDKIIFVTAEDCNVGAVKLLVRFGAELKIINSSEQNLLHIAARTNNIELLQYLLTEGLSVNHQDNNGNTPIMIAALFGDIKSVWTLVESGADYTHTNANKQNIFHNATSRANEKLVLFCMCIGMDPNQGDIHGNTPFLLAAQSCSSNLTQQMINCGANPSFKNNESRTILHMAARYANFGIIDLCIEVGLNINQCDKNGDSPIFLAVKYADINTVLNLVFHGANLQTTNSQGQTILHIAAERGNVGIVNYCLIQGLNPNQKDNDGDTPLFLAAENGDVETVHMLISYGGDYNSVNQHGQNILQVAADWLNKNLVSYCVNVLFIGKDKPEISPFQILQSGFRLPKVKRLHAVLKCQNM